MVRVLPEYKINPVNDSLTVRATDEPGPGGAHYRYEVGGYHIDSNPSMELDDVAMSSRTVLLFQNGPVGEVGVNGITHEALLEVLIDRLRGFQSGPLACEEHAIALQHLQEARYALHYRIWLRRERGVEGTYKA